MDLPNTIQNDMLKQKEEEAQNQFGRVADLWFSIRDATGA
ncbi:hypothetical protein PC129_g18316 [Phytophthora cactorum]|uniref:Uncharacterized protein n=1 Tax=Phytophthora cactorum TaxID=29920 RepID=A0A329RLI3_9STRA|nr:hypothetical protein Pcac1_g5754 [Phytophthora cactorum]KAG2803467.1 hypothetical protein PC112_g19159 [Phytophthora cactorum]KAG2803657.1 hypothetical protein PC111_g18595 [Phytophthora cactorum]KAG2840017.1 hypothetical protein PC113_g19353 [Phytophthora cactorum]KAG2884234.1 hypothetical protein PC114_g20205 [Phytophthora cactorum]